MRILLITDNHTATGGAEHSFFELKRQLQATSHTVYSLGFGKAAEQGNDFQIFPALKSNASKLLWRTFLHPIMYFKLRRAIRHFKPDVIHLHNIKQYSIALLKAVQGYKVVQTVHDFGVICPEGLNLHLDMQPCVSGFNTTCFWQHQLKYKKLAFLALLPAWFRVNRLLKKTVHTFMAPSPLLTDYLHRNHFHEAQWIPPFRELTSAQDYNQIEKGHFFFAGALGMHKGVHLLLQEFARALKIKNDLQLTIAGIGPEEMRMKQLTDELGMQKQVHFVGWQTELDHYYAKAQAVIFPSIGLESFGLVMTEAMARARPVIAANRGTSAWLVQDEQTGLLFDPLKPGELANCLIKLSQDQSFAKALGWNGRLKVEAMQNNQSILNTILTIYQKQKRAP